MASPGKVLPPLTVEKFVKKMANTIIMIFCQCYQNPIGQLLQKNFTSSRSLPRDQYWRGGVQEIRDFRGL